MRRKVLLCGLTRAFVLKESGAVNSAKCPVKQLFDVSNDLLAPTEKFFTEKLFQIMRKIDFCGVFSANL